MKYNSSRGQVRIGRIMSRFSPTTLTTPSRKPETKNSTKAAWETAQANFMRRLRSLAVMQTTVTSHSLREPFTKARVMAVQALESTIQITPSFNTHLHRSNSIKQRRTICNSLLHGPAKR